MPINVRFITYWTGFWDEMVNLSLAEIRNLPHYDSNEDQKSPSQTIQEGLMNPNATITDEQFQAFLKKVRELVEGPYTEWQLSLIHI